MEEALNSNELSPWHRQFFELLVIAGLIKKFYVAMESE